ncbi:MAG: hypothetical protein K2I48_07755 [Muribaculaceae bacterium]|nr:hypothetical protein [Muribaculaceae bacterium]
MKKIFTAFAAIACCALAANAEVTMTLADGTPVSNGETLTTTEFHDQSIPQIGMIRIEGKIQVNVDGVAPINVAIKASSDGFFFCPVGQNCYTFQPEGDYFVAAGSLTDNSNIVPVEMVYSETPVPAEVNWLEATFTDATGSEFVAKFAFDSNEYAGIEEIIGEAANVTVYDLSGVQILDNAPAEALSTLPAGLYIVNGKKVALK